MSLGEVLVGVVQLLIIVGFYYIFYQLIRVLIRLGAIRYPTNPLLPGWRQLHDQYGSEENVHITELISGWVGARNYDLKIIFNAQDVVIRNMMSSSVAVQIPYTEIQIVQAPVAWQLTRSSEKKYTDGKFQAGGVIIELPAYWADQLIKYMSAVSSVS
ncbi:hypothetical protein GCM10011375_07850 [Hymenobacter qilianensis]|uniref:Uncharacterized protein n=1 Tax=Hymenobacter qilianensis TaxID=1385715 RepID=A0ACB5PN56_9BACT|nr:hypothetical protein GCM10011375_07850 [Hymenobacter qilianensis]